nr:repressor of filamentous growth 1 [Quercus suber]
MHTIPQGGQNFFRDYTYQQTAGRSQAQIQNSDLQPWDLEHVGFDLSLESNHLALDDSNIATSTLLERRVSNRQTYFQAIPEAMQRSGVISIGSRGADIAHAILPLGYPVWHHPRIGHFSPVQHDPELGYYVPLQPPASSRFMDVPGCVDTTMNFTQQSEQPVPQTALFRKRSVCYEDDSRRSKRPKAANAEVAPRHVSISEDNRSIRQVSPELKVKKNPDNVIKSCVCRNAHAYTPRPSNPFVLYKSQHSKIFTELAQQARRQGDVEHSTPAKQASKAWNAESVEVKKKFKALAEREKKDHARKYPNYRYEPNMKQAYRFGDHTCRCGAYNVNCATLRSRHSNHDRRRSASYMQSISPENNEHELDVEAPSSVVNKVVPAVIPSIEDVAPLFPDSETIGNWGFYTESLRYPEATFYDNGWSTNCTARDNHSVEQTGHFDFDQDLATGTYNG